MGDKENREHTKAVAKAMAKVIRKDQRSVGGNQAGSGDATQRRNSKAVQRRRGDS